MAGHSPESAAAILRALLNSMECGGRIRQQMALAFWPLAVGPVVAQTCTAEEVRDGVLYVRTPGSTWSQELSLLKHNILPRLNSMIGASAVKDIKFRVGGKRQSATPPAPAAPTEEELARVMLREEDQREMQVALEEALAIRDETVREATIRLIRKAYRLSRWRLEHGWRPCPSCGALFPDDAPRCTLCRSSR